MSWAQTASNPLLLGWVPTEAPADGRYEGSSVCTKCHADQARSSLTAMAHALQPAGESEILRSPGNLTFAEGPFRHEIVRRGDRAIYTVTDGKETISQPLRWSFGHGKVGQTYLFEREGSFYEGRVSYYLGISGLDLTFGAKTEVPKSLQEAAGRLLESDELRGCFGCHSTGAIRGSQLSFEDLTPGLTCEGCHGTGVNHVQAIQAGNFQNLAIESLRGMGADEQADFCGSCHVTLAQGIFMGMEGLTTVRFPPYRLASSRCYDEDDARIGCIACHNPHENLVEDASHYDSKCLACHASNAGTAAGQAETKSACPVGREQCSRCHMPKHEIPGSHFQFTDHRIRVARPGDPYPN